MKHKTDHTQNVHQKTGAKPAQEKQIFRKASLDRISSPEQLTDYLRVTNPSTWFILGAVIVLLAGMLIWACVGHLETVVEAEAASQNGQLVVIVPVKDAESVKPGQTVRVNRTEQFISLTEQDDYGRTIAYAPSTLPDGEYSAEIVTEELTPVSFLLR